MSAYPFTFSFPLANHSFLISSIVFPDATYIFHGWELHHDGDANDIEIISFNIASGIGFD